MFPDILPRRLEFPMTLRYRTLNSFQPWRNQTGESDDKDDAGENYVCFKAIEGLSSFINPKWVVTQEVKTIKWYREIAIKPPDAAIDVGSGGMIWSSSKKRRGITGEQVCEMRRDDTVQQKCNLVKQTQSRGMRWDSVGQQQGSKIRRNVTAPDLRSVGQGTRADVRVNKHTPKRRWDMACGMEQQRNRGMRWYETEQHLGCLVVRVNIKKRVVVDERMRRNKMLENAVMLRRLEQEKSDYYLFPSGNYEC
ncbi:hypothetical protein J6590_067165 [Homalodisca vitripennis]|nr:hypothetical protein J6590_067165 [Homalodisca vitripennis]